MGNIKIVKGVFDSSLELVHAEVAKSPNPTTRWSDVIPLNLNAKKK